MGSSLAKNDSNEEKESEDETYDDNVHYLHPNRYVSNEYITGMKKEVILNDQNPHLSFEQELAANNVKTLKQERDILSTKTFPSKRRINLKFETDDTYYASGLKRSLHGTIYQLKLLMLVVIRAIYEKYDFFCLATEMDIAEKFDDIVFKYIKSNKTFWRFMQVKHKNDPDKNKITFKALVSNDNEFSLQKYFISCCKIKDHKFFKGAVLQDFLIITNTGFDLREPTKKKFGRKFKSLETWKNLFESTCDLDEDGILHFNGVGAVKYKFKASARMELKKMFELNLLNSALESKHIGGLSEVKKKLKAIKVLHFKDSVIEASQAVENIQNEYDGERRKGRIIDHAKKVLTLTSEICENEELKKERDNLDGSPAKGKYKNIIRLSEAFEKVKDAAECVSNRARDKLKHSEANLNKYKDSSSNEFKNLEAENLELSNDEINLRSLIDIISNSDSFSSIQDKIQTEIVKGRLPKTILDEKMDFDELKDNLIKKLEKVIAEISILQVAINDKTFEHYLDEFIDKFGIVTGFPNEGELRNLIRLEIGGKFDILNADLISDSLQQEILDFFKYYQDKKGRFYSSYDAHFFFSTIKKYEQEILDRVWNKLNNRYM